jgi:uncharacterized alpha-E superfamily protein
MHHHTLSGERPHQVVELSLWLCLLRACSGFEAFMRRNQGRVSRAGVASFLLFEAQFPRSLRYCLRSALSIMEQIWPREGVAARPIAALHALGSWFDALEPVARTLSIHELLSGVVDRTSGVCALLGQEILGPPRPPPLLDAEQPA